MLVPLSWLKEYIEIKLPPALLAERLTEVGLGVENIEEEGNDLIFDLEVTPNRPDWLSVVGVAREIAAIEERKVELPKVHEIKPAVKTLPFTIKTDYSINPRFTGIIITGIKVGKSPKWLVEKLEKINQRSINNIVDITNFVMWELGNPLHAFDYDKIDGKIMNVDTAREGEEFESVDGVLYRLPKGAVVIRDAKKIIDLCGIKGGKNSGTQEDTKTIFLRVPAEIPNLIRRASTALDLRSDASSIFEKGVDKGATLFALKRATSLILDIAGGEIASEIYDLKEKDFLPWKVKVGNERIKNLLGINIEKKQIQSILERLYLSPEFKNDTLEVTVPTYRNDLREEEDIIEEIARIYGYSNFPLTLPAGEIKIQKIPYLADYSVEKKVKDILRSGGFSEIRSYSLVSETDLENIGINPQKILRVDNPVSREYEYLRPTLKIGLLKGFLENKKIGDVNLFELGKVYKRKDREAIEEYFLSGISSSLSYAQVKGIVEKILAELGGNADASLYIEIMKEGIAFEFSFSEFEKRKKPAKVYKRVPKYPPIIEDVSAELPSKTKVGDIIREIKKQSPLIYQVLLIDEFENSKTFRIVYQHSERNLTNEEVGVIRQKIINYLNKKFSAKTRA